MTEAIEHKEPHKNLIIFLSAGIPVVVAILFFVKVPGYDLSFLPPIYAGINGVTAVLLVAALIAVKNKKFSLHELIMKTCIGLSVLFLLLYIAYHMTSDPTHFGGSQGLKYVYFFILVTHIILSIIVIPLVLFTFVRAQAGNFQRHRALAKWTFPIWLYVAVTGVVVYVMISPYYK